MKFLTQCLILIILLTSSSVYSVSSQKADEVLVIKSERRLYLINNGKTFATYKVTFGGDPNGHKQIQGDQKTPEGKYLLDYKNANSRYYKSIHISYPNKKDRENAKRLGASPGGEIMIHGQLNGWEWAAPLVQLFSWTDGCIALTNKDMDQLWLAIDPGTPIEIKP